MKNSSKVLFTVLNFNGWEETLPCIDAILKQTYQNFHILLIDNGSHDQSLKRLAKFDNHERVTFIKNPVNLGFAGGVNMGIRRAIEENYDYIVLLNNDAIITENWLETLIKTAKKTGASSVTGLLLSGDGKKIESTADSLSTWGMPFPRQRDEDVSEAHDSGYVFGGTAGATLYKTSLFKDIGLFDEKFFAYFEDTDINFRAQLAGHKAYYEKSAIAFHDHGTTSGKMPGFTVYQTFKNLPMFFWKNVPAGLFLSTGLRFLIYYSLIYLRAVLRGQFVVATKGVFKSVAYSPHTLKERWRIQKNRRVSTGYLLDVMYKGLPPANKRTVKKVFGR